MRTLRYLWQSLVYYRVTHLAVLLGVIAGTAVIAGALIVGDSVRGSLRQMTLVRLGQIDYALQSHRFFREELAAQLANLPEFGARFSAAAPALVMRGSLEHKAGDATSRANKVNVYGVDDRAWQLTEHGSVAAPAENEVLLSRRVADALGVQAGDDVTLWVELPSSIPRDSLLGERDETSRELALQIRAVLDDALGAARLDMNPSQQLPLNAFVRLGTLQTAVNLHRHRKSPQSRAAVPARVNTILASAKNESDAAIAAAPSEATLLTNLLTSAWGLDDLSLRTVVNENRGYVSLESEQLLLENAVATADREAVKKLSQAAGSDVRTSPVLVYLANELVNTEDPNAFSMYSVIAGLDLAAGPPFGPLEFIGPKPDLPLKDDQIVINVWLARDLKIEVGGKLKIRYYEVGSRGELPEVERVFTVAGILKLDGTPADDRGLTPEVEGITDADTLAEWDQPFPMQLNRITPRDDAYWRAHRATPKGFLSLEFAQKLWRSRYGELTSFRVASVPGKSADESAQALSRELLALLKPESVDLAFRPVKFQGLLAASGTTDFSGLFFGFSFFIILSAMILIGLLFRLGIERRASGIGLLGALGLSPRRVRWLFLAEGLIVVCAGGLLGIAAAVVYAHLMVYGLKTWWIGAIGTRFLYVFVTPRSLVTGFLISTIVMALAVWWAMRQLRRMSPRELLSGATEPSETKETSSRHGRWARAIAAVSAGMALLLIVAVLCGLVPAQEAFMGLSWYVLAFFVVGVALLTANLAFLSAWLVADRSSAVRGAGLEGLRRLGMRNASRHRQRSVLTVGLIASATFIIVAVAAGKRNPAVETPDKNSGNGGFVLVAESSTPVLYDLNTASGREKLDIRPARTPTSGPASSSAGIDWNKVEVLAFRVRPGEDASCLNLYQTRLPTILGVPQAMIERGGFKFANTPADAPWKLLNQPLEGGAVPVIGDMNTLMYSLHKEPGDVIAVPDEAHPAYKLQIVGMLDGSVLQGVLLMSEDNFRKLYPERAGSQYFLIGDRRFEGHAGNDPATRMSPDEFARLSGLLETELTQFGFDAEPVAGRLAAFLAVQNTYLSTFQTLGGLGLLLGTFGLATVMLRNVLERRAELALFRAVGFRKGSLAWLVLFENAFLLLWGLAAGTISALLAMTPHLTNVGADFSWGSGAVLLIGVFLVGMLAALFAVREALRTPILATLRSE